MADALVNERSNHGLRPGRKLSWGISPTTARASASREKKPQLPQPAEPKPAPVETVAAAATVRAFVIDGKMTTIVAEIADYNEMVQGFRKRIEFMQITRLELDHQSGMQQGYSAKLLGPAQIKKFGSMSLGSTLGAIGCKLLLVEDQAATEKIMRRCEKSKRPLRGTVMR